MEKGWKFKKEKTDLIVGTEAKPTQFKSGEVIINKKSTKKHLDKLIQINNDGINKEPKGKVTNDATEGGLLKGKPHYDENGNPTGGIPGIVDGVKKIETEGDEFVVNAEASRKHWQELSKINQEDGNGVAIGPQDANYEEDPEEEYKGGGKIEFNANHIPSKWVMSYAKKIKSKYPEIWKLGGNIFGNQAFENLERVFNRGYWLDSEKWMYIKWRSYVARHQRDYHIGGVVAMLKWVDKVEKGWPYMKELIEAKITKKGWKHKQSSKKMDDGGNVNNNTLKVSSYILERHPKNGDVLQGGKFNGYQIVKTVKETKLGNVNYKLWLKNGINRRIVTYSPQNKKVSDFLKIEKSYAKGSMFVTWTDEPIGGKMKDGGNVITYKDKYNTKYGYKKGESHSLEQIHIDSGVSMKGLQQIYDKGIGAYKTNPSSVRPNVKSKEQWAMARVYSSVMGGKAAKIDAKELKMVKGGGVGQEITCVKCDWHWNTNQSEEFDKYVCHNCGTDNSMVYAPKKHKEGGLIAPNQKPSNLTPQQYKLVRTPEFKSWFGDWENDPENASKIVDENGEPKMVYHGTNEKFTIFSLEKVGSNVDYGMWGSGFYFSPIKSFSKGYGSNLLKVFLNIRNPFVRNPNLTGSKTEFKPVYGKEESIQLRNEILNANYDGVLQYESGQKNLLTQIVAFEPEQIKLADGTNKTFDGSNPDIRFEDGGKVNSNFTPILEWRMMGVEQEDGTYKYVPYNEFYLWIYDDVHAEQKLKDGIYEYPYPTIEFNDDLESIWSKNKFKRYKGNKHIVGFVYGHVTEYLTKKGYFGMEIYVMTTKPNFRRQGVNQFAIRYLRNKFNLDKEQVEFKYPTEKGKLFIASNKFLEGGNVNEKKIRVKVEYLEEQFYELNKEIDVPVSVFKQYQKTGKVPREFLNDLTSEIEDKNWVETNPMSVHLTLVENMSKGGTLMVKGNLVKVGDTGIYNGRVKEDITVTSISPKIVTFVTSNGVKKGVYTYKFEKFYIPSNVEKPISETIEEVKVEDDKEELNKKFDLLNKKYVKYSKLLDQKTKVNENTDDIEKILDDIQEQMSLISNKIEKSQEIYEPILEEEVIQEPIIEEPKIGKMAYEMTLDEYQAKVSPIIKDYRKFIKKYEKWFAASAYNGLLYVSLEEVIDALNSGISYSNFRLPSKDDWTYRNFTPEQQARYEYSYRKTRNFDENYTQEPTPKYLIDEKNNYINKFKEFFTKDEIESRVEQDELKSNKRSVKRAIDNGTYAKMLESGEITIERLNEIGDSVGVRIPRSVLSPKDKLKAEFEEKKRKALSQLPRISIEKMDALIKNILEDLKQLEPEIFISERKRILELFSEVTKLKEISADDLSQMNLPPINVYIVTTVRVIEEDRRIKQKFVKVELSDNWEKELNKFLVEFIEALKYKIIFSIINNFDRITVPIFNIERLNIEVGKKGFQGQYKFMFENGCSFIFETQSIPAGGYNIQSFHYRFISNFINLTSATGERIPSNEFYKYFNAENYSKLQGNKEEEFVKKTKYKISILENLIEGYKKEENQNLEDIKPESVEEIESLPYVKKVNKKLVYEDTVLVYQVFLKEGYRFENRKSYLGGQYKQFEVSDDSNSDKERILASFKFVINIFDVLIRKEQQEIDKLSSYLNTPYNELLFAPNGKVSNLNSIQYALVRTTNFKAWFGDWENDPKNASKVVDENGEPKVLYRGFPKRKNLGFTFKNNVNLFGSKGVAGRQTNKFGFYFTDSLQVAESYANNLTETGKEKTIQSYFLNIRKLAEIINKDYNEINDDLGWVFNEQLGSSKYVSKEDITPAHILKSINLPLEDFKNYAERLNRDIYNEISRDERYSSNNSIFTSYLSSTKHAFQYFVNWGKYDNNEDFWRTILFDLGYDGVSFYESTHTYHAFKYALTYACFESNQIKLADGTNINFDPEKEDVRFDQGGNVDSIEKANIKIDKLPNGKLFDDAKNIEGIFDRSKYSWSEVIENFEKNKNSATLESININDIHITQPNIQSNKVKSIIKNINSIPVINVIQFKNGEKSIYDGHHRLVANWALGNNMIKVNLVKVNDYFNEGGNVDQKDTVTLDIPLLIRTLELAREDIKSDEELHKMVERLLNLKNKKELTMDDYEYIANIQKLKK